MQKDGGRKLPGLPAGLEELHTCLSIVNKSGIFWSKVTERRQVENENSQLEITQNMEKEREKFK